jgi:hypothetical protein
MAHRNIRAVIEKTSPRIRTRPLWTEAAYKANFSANRNARLASMRLDGHHGAAGGFSADGAKRRRIAFSNLHVQGCALHVFVMAGSIGKFAAAQQTMVFIYPIKTIF